MEMLGKILRFVLRGRSDWIIINLQSYRKIQLAIKLVKVKLWLH